MAWTTSDKVMGLRERFRPFDIFAEMMDGWRRHLSGRNASLFAFFSFLSIFPLMLAAISILGFVLHGNPDLQRRIVDSAAKEIPVLGPQLVENTEAIDGSVWALVIGLTIALFSSTKALVGLEGALDDAWEVDVDDRASAPVLRGKALLGLAILAVSQIASFAIALVVTSDDFPAVGNIALIGATAVLNIVVIAAMYRFLTSYSTTWSDVWIGAIFAGAILALLQQVGTLVVTRQAQNVAEPMKTINTILGLLAWLSLIGITVIMCAELNAARKRLGNSKHVQRGREMNLVIRN